MKTYLVKSIFGPTIQGEGRGQGEVVLFLRFAGCNKWSGRAEDKATSACPFCDTDFVGGRKMTATDIVQELLALDPDLKVRTLVISGGEPTLQLDEHLAEVLSKLWCVYVETNGSRRVEQKTLDFLSHVCCSPKQSPEETKIQRINSLKVLHPAESPERSIFAFLKEFGHHRHLKIYIQPVMDQNYEANLAECVKICVENPKVRLSVQLHKVIGVE